jgi:hypothetical protein
MADQLADTEYRRRHTGAIRAVDVRTSVDQSRASCAVELIQARRQQLEFTSRIDKDLHNE